MLELINISKKIGSFSISNVNLKVEKGDYYVLLGKSGSGKSMLLEIITGLQKPDSGRIIYEGKDITSEQIRKRKIGLLYQDFALFPHMTVFKNIVYPLRNQHRSKSESKEIVEQLAIKFGIRKLLERKPGNLSGGEKQRVALARTLALKPAILLLDEPLTSLDVQIKNKIRNKFRKLSKEGQTIIHVTHDFQEAIMLSDKVAILHNGAVLQKGKTKDVFKKPANEFVANLTGIQNYFPARIQSTENSSLKLAIVNDRFFCEALTENNIRKGYILLRNEDIILSRQQLQSSLVNNKQGKIMDILPRQYGIEVLIDVGVDLYATISRESMLELNLKNKDTIWVSFKASAVKLLK